MTTITIARLRDALHRMDAPLFIGDMNLNIIGIRSCDRDANTFNDVIAVLYQRHGEWQVDYMAVTTDPGLFYRNHPISKHGTAILKPGHYRSCWQIGKHRGKYTALVQRAPMTVYRDNDKDGQLDGKKEHTGIFGINLHHASAAGLSMQVDRWSAGCQVIAGIDDFNYLMALVKKSAHKYGPRFSYTLITEDMLNADR